MGSVTAEILLIGSNNVLDPKILRVQLILGKKNLVQKNLKSKVKASKKFGQNLDNNS